MEYCQHILKSGKNIGKPCLRNQPCRYHNNSKQTIQSINQVRCQEEKDEKYQIVELFLKNIKGKTVPSKTHCGSEGHWLESQMGILHNCKNKPDILGYELKKWSKKITLGDFSATEYIFSQKRNLIVKLNENLGSRLEYISRSNFIKYFGSPNNKKNNRYSWSGTCVPKYGVWNDYGQKLCFTIQLDLCIFYSPKYDKRKIEMPLFLKNNVQTIIVLWSREKLQNHINDKFNQKGCFLHKKQDKSMIKYIFVNHLILTYLWKILKTEILYLIVECMREITEIIPNLEVSQKSFGTN